MLSLVDGLNFELTWCRSAGRALRALTNESFDIILTDYLIGQDDSESDFFTDVRSLNSAAQIIVISSEMDNALGASLLKTGVTDYLIKGSLG